MTETFLVSFTKRTISVSGRLTSNQWQLFRTKLFKFELQPRASLRLDFTGCEVFSTACIPPLMDFIQAAKKDGANVSIMAGSTLRRTLAISSVNIGIKRLDDSEV